MVAEVSNQRRHRPVVHHRLGLAGGRDVRQRPRRLELRSAARRARERVGVGVSVGVRVTYLMLGQCLRVVRPFSMVVGE